MIKSLTDNTLFNLLAVCLLTLGVEYMIFTDIMLHPNNYMFSGSGDGLQIYFNNVFHVKYGQGVTLANQLYPTYDILFMTDAQSSITLILKFINKHIFPVEENTVGIINITLLLAVPLCSMFLYLIFKYLKVSNVLSIVFSIGICFLSPQLARLTCGHFGLGYPCYIPMLLYFLLRLTEKNKPGWFFAIVFTILFFGFNNAHMMLTGVFIALAYGLFSYFTHTNGRNKVQRLIPFISGILPLIIVYVIFAMLDFHHDREKVPWGFITFYAQAESIFLPASGLVHRFWEAIIPVKIAAHQWEGEAYIGTLSFLVLCGIIVRTVKNIFKKRFNRIIRPFMNPDLNIIYWTGILILVYAMAIPFKYFADYCFMERIPLINQFRCPGRFAWVFFYTLSICCVYYFNLLWIKYRSRKKVIAMTFLSITAFTTYAVDGFQFKKTYFNHISQVSDNLFSGKKYTEEIAKFHIDSTHYQAILGIPNFNAWNAKFVTEDAYFTSRNSHLMSYMTALPELNAKLSRISVSGILLSSQLYSNPLIKKTLFEKINSKNVLLIVNNTGQISANEQFLISKSTLLFKDNECSYYSLSPKNGWNELRQAANTRFDSISGLLKNNVYTDGDLPIVAKGLNEIMPAGCSMATTLLDTVLEINDTSLYEASIWQIADYTKFGSATIDLITQNATGDTLYKENRWFSKSVDYQLNKQRVDFQFRPVKGKNHISVIMNKTSNICRQLLIRPVNQQVYEETGGKRYLNNYCINE